MNHQLDKKIKPKITRTVIRNNKAGFVSLIALLLANVFLLIGLSVFAISIKELNLSFGGRESLFAFYAADGGMECALYWDIQQDAFATSSPIDEITCNNKTISVSDGGSNSRTFEYSFDTAGNDVTFPCAEVFVTKRDDMVTEIISRGRNNCDLNDPRRVERAWRVVYD